MWAPTANRRRLQLALVVALAGVLVVAVLSRAERMAVEAERMAMELQLEWLNTLATLRFGRLLASEGVAGAAAIEGANPMLWDTLASPDPLSGSLISEHTGPGGYVGERSISGEADLAPGNWAFDPERGLLFYRFRFPPVTDGARSPALVGYRAQLIFDDLDADGQFDPGRERVSGARVVQVALP